MRKIRIRLAAPAMFAGARTASVQVLAGATLAPFIGGGGLGDFVVTGIALWTHRGCWLERVPLRCSPWRSNSFSASLKDGFLPNEAGRDYSRARHQAVSGNQGRCSRRSQSAYTRRVDGRAHWAFRVRQNHDHAHGESVGRPDGGRILVNGEDVTNVDPVILRRHIGYVIQQVGLFRI